MCVHEPQEMDEPGYIGTEAAPSFGRRQGVPNAPGPIGALAEMLRQDGEGLSVGAIEAGTVARRPARSTGGQQSWCHNSFSQQAAAVTAEAGDDDDRERERPAGGRLAAGTCAGRDGDRVAPAEVGGEQQELHDRRVAARAP
jgi:hypothetical protein